MKKTVYDFTPPQIVGALGDDTLDPAFARTIERTLKKDGRDAVCLPFVVAPRYLKNIVTCMRLMDIVGLAVHPSHGKRIMKWLPSVEKRAKDAGFVDVVVRRGKRFVGLNAWARAAEADVRKNSLEKVRREILIDLIFQKG